MPRRPRTLPLFLILTCVLAAACDEGIQTVTLAEIESVVDGDLRFEAGSTGTLAVRVLDDAGDPVSDVGVTWAVVSGGGSITPTEIRTDVNGEARTEWTVGPTLGEQRVEASADGVDPLEFTATVVGPVDTLLVETDSVAFEALKDTVALVVHAVDAAGQDRSEGLEWMSRAATVATVDTAGGVTSEGAGETWVVGVAGELSDSAHVTVTQVPVGVVASRPDSIFVLGDSVRAEATVVDGNGYEIPEAEVAWASLDPSVVETRSGWVIGVAVGEAEITAAIDLASDTTIAAVTPPSDPPEWEVLLDGEGHRDVWGSSAMDVWVITQRTMVRHWDGSTWTRSVIRDAGNLGGIWGSSASDVWVAGTGFVGRYDGASWAFEELPENNNLQEIHGTGASDVYTVSNSGNIWHYDGAGWEQVGSGYGVLEDVWATGSDDVWAAGWDRTLVHYDGTSWTEVAVPAELAPNSDNFIAVWASSATDVWVTPHAGDRGLLHYDGDTWEFLEFFGPLAPYEDVWGSGPNDIWVTGTYGNILHYDGDVWTRPYTEGLYGRFYGIWGTPDGHVFAAGESYEMGATVAEWDGAEWTVHLRGFGTLHDVWSASSTDIWAVESGGRSFHYDGTDWSYVATGATGDLWGVWGAAPDDVYAVGRDGQIFHFNGADWSEQASPVTRELRAVWGRSATDIWAVGDMGAVVHYDGAVWSEVGGAPTVDLASAWGTDTDLYVGGYGTNVYRYDDGAWTPIPTGEPTMDLWAGKGVVWSAHTNGYVGRHETGTEWPTERADIHQLYGITGTEDPDVVADVVAVGDRTVLHHNGLEWEGQALPEGLIPLLDAVVTTGPDEFIAVGTGIILKGTR